MNVFDVWATVSFDSWSTCYDTELILDLIREPDGTLMSEYPSCNITL